MYVLCDSRMCCNAYMFERGTVLRCVTTHAFICVSWLRMCCNAYMYVHGTFLRCAATHVFIRAPWLSHVSHVLQCIHVRTRHLVKMWGQMFHTLACVTRFIHVCCSVLQWVAMHTWHVRTQHLVEMSSHKFHTLACVTWFIHVTLACVTWFIHVCCSVLQCIAMHICTHAAPSWNVVSGSCWFRTR